MTGLPDGFQFRAAVATDATAIANLWCARSLAILGAADTDEEEIHAWMTTPDAAREFRVVTDGRGVVTGVLFNGYAQTSEHVVVMVEVAMEHVGGPLHEALLDEAIAAANRSAGGRPICVTGMTADPAMRSLAERRGLVPVRYFPLRHRDFSEPIDKPVWPDGFEFRPVDVATELAAAHECFVEAFRDHYGGSFLSLVEFQQQTTLSTYDADLWLAVWQGGQVVAASCTHPTFPDIEGYGYVAELGVRRDARGKGLAIALLLETFRRMRAKGLRGCALHVDAESATGATRLYDRAGMETTERYVNYGSASSVELTSERPENRQ